jgi:hypothetical protein
MKNETNKRTQRTPAEIIAETEAKLERLRMKEAKQAAQNPTRTRFSHRREDRCSEGDSRG